MNSCPQNKANASDPILFTTLPSTLSEKNYSRSKIICVTRFRINIPNNSTFPILGTPMQLIDVDRVIQSHFSTLSNRGVAMGNQRCG